MRKITLLIVLLLVPTFALAGSAGQINQEMGKGEDWVQIVNASTFPLGDTTKKHYENMSYLETAYGAYPSLDGSTVSVPMAREFARQHLQLSEVELEAFVRFSTTHDAYVNLIENKPNLGSELPFRGSIMDQTHAVDIFIGTEPSEEERKLAEQNDVKLTTTPICYDAFVFIVNAENPVESLTVSQIQDIYSGKTLYWEQLGVNDIGDEDGIEGQTHIFAYTRQRNSGSQTAMDNLVMQGIPMAINRANFYQVFEMSDLVENIGSFENSDVSIGYTYKFYIDTLYKNDGIKAIAIDGIAPTTENIRSGAYPFATCYYAVTREGESEAFVAWMTSEEGQRVIKQAGYIPYMAGV